MIPDVIQHLQFDTGGHIVDGELILLTVDNRLDKEAALFEGYAEFALLQDTMKAAKKYRPELSPKLFYFVYDIVDSDEVFTSRYATLEGLVDTDNVPNQVVLVPTVAVHDEADVVKAHAEFVSNRYEGTMIRDDSCGYDIGHRSNSLQKFKDFVDDEFLIVNIKEGGGSESGLAIFECIIEDGMSLYKRDKSIIKDKEFQEKYMFACHPQGTRETRKELLNNKSDLVDEYLTVQYFELTKDGKPQFPVGICVRDEDDFKR